MLSVLREIKYRDIRRPGNPTPDCMHQEKTLAQAHRDTCTNIHGNIGCSTNKQNEECAYKERL